LQHCAVMGVRPGHAHDQWYSIRFG
jgi:hypothetical protein